MSSLVERFGQACFYKDSETSKLFWTSPCLVSQICVIQFQLVTWVGEKEGGKRKIAYYCLSLPEKKEARENNN
jgi:hypothetical protein